MNQEQLQAIRTDAALQEWTINGDAKATDGEKLLSQKYTKTVVELADEIERLRGVLDRIERRSQAADRQFEEREGSPHRFDLSWWRGHADGLSKAADIARQAVAGEST